jgi:FMN phosphatase YigB (HAD superfamily)
MKHVIFDLGNVIAFFDHRRAARQLASLAEPPVTEEDVFRAVFGTSLEPDLDCGRMSSRQFIEHLRRTLYLASSDAAIAEAWCDIFHPNDAVIALLPRLKQSPARLVLASNTNELHFEWIARHWSGVLALFDEWVLSYRVGLRKPAPAFFWRCAEAAGAAPCDCVFVDDRSEFVERARAIGMAGITYRPDLDLEGALRSEGVEVA